MAEHGQSGGRRINSLRPLEDIVLVLSHDTQLAMPSQLCQEKVVSGNFRMANAAVGYACRRQDDNPGCDELRASVDRGKRHSIPYFAAAFRKYATSGNPSKSSS